jgi:HD superfamily phosphodiesterase
VARHAERIGKAEKGNLAVILSAAYLLDIDAAAEGPQGNVGAEQAPTFEPIGAREILTRLGAREELIHEVCAIITRRRSGRSGDSINSQAVYDADVLERLDEEYKNHLFDAGELAERIERSLLTAAGREAAREVLLTSR